MHSLETGIVVSIAVFFFYSFLSFAFLRERNITSEIAEKVKKEQSFYTINQKKDYNPELINNIVDIIREEDKIKNGYTEE